jgi:hypothetical protein
MFPFDNPEIMAHFTAAKDEIYENPPVKKDEEEILTKLQAQWEEKAADVLTGAPPKLPPFREINHRIPLIDENKVYHYHLLRCPDVMKGQLVKKIQHYKDSGWWIKSNVPQAAPMLCIAKKDGKTL